MSWADVVKTWEPSWKALLQGAVRHWRKAVTANPRKYEAAVRQTVDHLAAARADLDVIRTLLPGTVATKGDAQAWTNFRLLARRYHDLAAGLHIDEEKIRVGAAPLLVVGGIGMGVTAIAWGLAANRYAANLREQTRLAAEELRVRADLAAKGKTLPPSTLPQPPASKPSTAPLLGVGALVLVLGSGLYLLNRRAA